MNSENLLEVNLNSFALLIRLLLYSALVPSRASIQMFKCVSFVSTYKLKDNPEK